MKKTDNLERPELSYPADQRANFDYFGKLFNSIN